jgi:hypothetical protein
MDGSGITAKWQFKVEQASKKMASNRRMDGWMEAPHPCSHRSVLGDIKKNTTSVQLNVRNFGNFIGFRNVLIGTIS